MKWKIIISAIVNNYVSTFNNFYVKGRILKRFTARNHKNSHFTSTRISQDEKSQLICDIKEKIKENERNKHKHKTTYNMYYIEN